MNPTKTMKLTDERVADLIATFRSSLDAFDTAKLFTGPSVYFYLKTVAVRSKHSNAVAALDDDEFFDGLYATLTAWGMHRMGPRGAKLADLPEIKASFQRHAEQIRQVQSFDLMTLPQASLEPIIDQLWVLMRELLVGVGATKMVANSKALHLLLPSVMPPIDREYTLRFFFNTKNVNGSGEPAFREIYRRFHAIAKSCREVIGERLAAGKGMDTCATKVIDNAIVGYVRTHLPRRSASD